MNRPWPLLATASAALLVWTSIFASSARGDEATVKAAVVVAQSAAPAVLNDPLDWPYWRGPEGNSISRETGLPDTINPDGGPGSNLAWKRADLGGRSTPIILRGKLYSIMRADPATPTEGERVVCVDAASGNTIWESRHNVWSSEVPDTRVGWSSLVGDPATGRVYALGACGLFECFEGDTGKIVWSIPLHEQLGLLSTYGGRTNFPVIVDDLVILGAVVIGWGDMAVPAHRLLGFDKATGKIAWFVSTRLRPEDTIYSGPTVAVIGGQKLLITGSGDGWVYALQPRTGQKVWEYQFSRRGLNGSPTVDGETIYMGHSEENWDDPANPTQKLKVGAVAAINGALTGNITKTGELWKNLEMAVGKGSIVKVGDRLVCPDDAGKLWVLDAKTGEPIGRKISVGTINFATPLVADGKVYHLEKNGRWYIFTPDEKDGLSKPVRGKTAGFFPSGDECWASPVVSHGKLYVQTTGALYCFEDTAKKHGSTARPALPLESPVAQDEKPAQVQVFPTEVLLRPGDKQQFTVRLFNSRGQFLSEAKADAAQFTLDGPGTISPAGEFAAPDDAAHVATIVHAKVGEISGRARIRMVPPLPWKFDFDALKDAPITWVGARYRHVLRPVDGSNVMVKITTIPRGTKSRLSMGQSDLSDYTVQQDFKAGVVDNKLPDTGVIAQGYTLEVSGENKWLKLFSWGSHDKRTFKEIHFDLEPNIWYTMKLRAANVDGKAQLQGKIWKRDGKEPAEWTIELIDPLPNSRSAPGLFGNATNAELYIDNVLVTSNSAN